MAKQLETLAAEVEKAVVTFETNLRYIKNSISNFNKLGADKQTAAVTQGRFALLEKYWEKCQTNATLIETFATKEQEDLPFFKENQLDQAEAFYIEAYDFFQTLLISTNTTPPTPPPPAARTPTREIQLPKINLPSFSGKIIEWLTFRDLFLALVKNQNNLSNVEKLQYLLTAVTGDASKLISHLSLTNDNFEVAWKSLSDCYENERVIIDAYLKGFFSIPTISSNVLSGLKQLRADSSESINALRALKCPVDHWNMILVYVLVQKLDKISRQEWEIRLDSEKEYPKLDKLYAFLDTRIRSLAAGASVGDNSKQTNVHSSEKTSGINKNTFNKGNNSKVVRSHHSTATNTCVFCSDLHRLMHCQNFLLLSVSHRLEFVQKNNLCRNCLSKGHQVSNCKSSFSCLKCKRKHHTLLHDDSKSQVQTNTSTNSTTCEDAPSVHAHVNTGVKPVLLATARVIIEANNGRCVYARALVDQGSDATFVSSRIAQLLRARLITTGAKVSGIGDDRAHYIRNSISISIRATNENNTVLSTTALVVPKITPYVPPSFKSNDYSFFSNLNLADSNLTSNDDIELLIGADLYGSIMLGGFIKHKNCSLIAQETIFGWLLSGPLSKEENFKKIHVHHATSSNLDVELRRFWELEEIPTKVMLSEENARCETHFIETHTRDAKGRYVVRLPFKSDPPINIGDSQAIATRSFTHLERRLAKSPDVSKQYVDFLSEYEALGHMQKIDNDKNFLQPTYLPHHPVIREETTTTKLRVVFNASANTSNGSSLNDHLMIGPKLQADLPAIILNWRLYKYVFSADIQQMFRQILVHENDRQYQLILWRSNPSESVHTYSLNTVTYGTACAPYLAQRVLKQLSIDESSNFPSAKKILQNEIYVDDILSGSEDKITAIQKRNELIQCLQSAGINLRKWASNDPEVLKDIDPSNHGLASAKPFLEGEQLKILGVRWTPRDDTFSFQMNFNFEHKEVSKRKILSTIAKIFDPLGWLSPVTVSLKILLQNLWKSSYDWDDSLPSETINEWTNFSQQLSEIKTIQIPRWLGFESNIQSLTIHGFCDASSKAYAAVIYSKLITNSGAVYVQLLMAKTKVAPLKTISIPRLELCAAHLLIRCITFTLEAMTLKNIPVFCWSDSTIVLSWLQKSPSDLKVFVANRVSAIQSKLPNAKWAHVPTEENPADCASRGVDPSKLSTCNSWWNGPVWLKHEAEDWPDQPKFVCNEEDLELKIAKSNKVHAHHSYQSEFNKLYNNISSWPRLLRITAYVKRFIFRSRFPDVVHSLSSLQANEIKNAQKFWIQKIQEETFSDEIKILKANKISSLRSSIRTLDPFIDNSGILRVGGRLKNADIQFDRKFPILLTKNPISKLIIDQVHRDTLHGGTQLMLRTLREQFWILRARDMVKNCIRNCVTCARHRAVTGEQVMADLPTFRVNPSRPFCHTGLDYAGPFFIRESSGRGRKSHKAYISLFVCLATRAIHLELVHDYSTAAFLASLERFVARRGIPSDIYSDNATTYQGADRELTNVIRQTLSDADVQAQFTSKFVQWHFIPPSAPHFGGMWEAGVKSVKHHLRRIMGNSTPTVEEFSTLLCNVEACLNSRPIAPLHDDVNSCEALTPGHFLIGNAIKSVPSPSVLNISASRLDRWQSMRAKYEQFWQLWSLDYLNTLQQRSKWHKRTDSFQVNDLVLIKNSNMPPCKWELARIIQCMPDKDGLVRVAQVKTASSMFVRPIVKLCKLPINIEHENA